MIPDTPNPASAAARTGSGKHHKRLASDFHDFKLPAPHAQAQIAARHGAPLLRVVTPMPPSRPRLREVRLTAIAGSYPYGGITRSFQLTDHGLDELIAIAAWLEARR